MFDEAYYSARGLSSIRRKMAAGERLDFEDGLKLFACPDLTAVGSLAHEMRTHLHDDKTHYVVNRQINYTNVCVNDCVFCAFRRDKASDDGAFMLGREDIIAKIEEAFADSPGLDELHIVGGCNPLMNLEFFENLFREIAARWPELPIKAFTPVEIAFFAKQENASFKNVLSRLRDAGLRMLAGGGAEIFDPGLREKICPAKADADAWLEVSAAAHSLGIKSNCTMLFGHLESIEQRLDHLMRLRRQQDESGGFECFIPLRYLPANNPLGARVKGADALESLRVIAISRLMLDNIPHIKAYWVMLGQKLAQTALWYGADDLDGTIVEERIGRMAGADSAHTLTLPELEEMIIESGFTPARRNALFAPV